MTSNELCELFEQAKSCSTCKNIRMAAVIETNDGKHVLGWNGPPERAGEHHECRLGGPISPQNIKHCPSVHAEVRAICRASEMGISTRGATLYLCEWYPCAPCALTLIEAGITKLVLAEDLNFKKNECYNFHLAKEYLQKAGVAVEIRRDLFPGKPQG
ncbi:MAG: deaminase [Candidatus Aureabacteria bacterium]|nr:deaminase [Candidatus Auribacterota bacterium]